MRVFYLLTILFLILFMSYEFDRIGNHYDYLGQVADLSAANVERLVKNCVCKPK